MSYRNRHQVHRADQVWNRDIRHSDEEDGAPRGSASGYSPGYSNSPGAYSSSYPQRTGYDDRSSYDRRNSNYQNDYSGNDNRRYDSERWNDTGRRDDRSNNRRGDYYDYNSGELRDHSDYDRNRYNRSYDNYDRRDGYSSNDNDRDWWDRSKDEVKSWFGDDAAERRREQDKRMSHRGKGPRGYQRSDERIKEDVNDRLSDDDYVDASDIDVEVNGSEVTLKGTVATKQEKRRAEDIAERVLGVRNVENRLRCTNPQGGINMDRYTGTTGDFTGIGSSSGTTSEIIRDVRNSKQR